MVSPSSGTSSKVILGSGFRQCILVLGVWELTYSLQRGHSGTICRVYIGIMEKNMEATTVGFGLRQSIFLFEVLISGLGPA